MTVDTIFGREVLAPHSGELVDLTSASDEKLAELIIAAEDYRAAVVSFEAEARAELLARLDRGAKWTRRVGDPERQQFELKSTKPTTGTTVYDPARLEEALQDLIEAGTLDQAAAALALRRTVTVTVEVPLGHDVERMAREVMDVEQVAGVRVRALKAHGDREAMKSGINAIEAVPGVKERLEEAADTVPAPKRTVKVKAIRKEARA